MVKETYADSGTRAFTYDCVGNMLTRTDQKGQTTNYIYSDLYFLIQRSYPVSHADNFTYDLSGRMLTAERGGWLVTFEYDCANRVIRTTQNGQVIEYFYDISKGQRTITYPGGRIITEFADLRGRLSNVNRGHGPIFPITPLALYTYDLGNRVMTRAYENMVFANYQYNKNNWVTNLEHTGATLIAGFRHNCYDKEGNKLTEEKLHDPSHSEAYQYDDIYRLIDYRVGTLAGCNVLIPSTNTVWNLDCLGNWNSKTTDGVTETRTHNTVNEITFIDSAPIYHDDNGNLQEDECYIYDYDEENRLTSVTRKSDSQMVGEYQYDALSRRVVKIADPDPAVTPTETHYFYDDARIIEEQNIAGVTQATYVYGNYIDEVLTMDRGGQTYYYHQNTLWSVAAVTDSVANVVERYAYNAYGCVTITDGSGNPVPPNPWGTPHSAISNPYMFTGRQLDEETGLYYYRARYYDCVKGRFLQRDPLRYVELGYVDRVNLYKYVRGNPTNWVDPLGLNNKPPQGRDPTNAEREDAERKYPNLKWGEWSITGERTREYNCIAWSCGILDRWVWDEVDQQTEGGNGNRTVEVEDFDGFYKKKGYQESKNCDPECKKRKIALFVKNGNPTHAARETADSGWWESKRGSNVRIMHRLSQLEGRVYGNVKKCYEIKDENANLALCPCPPEKKQGSGSSEEKK
ncbi:RHS repeat-associated core domain-containing protein [Candidatus Poribacteria bacterium]|nr:RHS repeat-associated core domain-containing protein [Candidatus Poribacteria bacterium]